MEKLDQYLIIVEVFQLLLFSFILFFNPNSKNVSRKILGILFFIIWVSFSDIGFYYLGYYKVAILLYYVFLPALLLIMPVFYFYVKSLTEENFRFHRKKFLHFIPSVLIFIINTPVFAMLTPGQKEWFIIYGFIDIGNEPILKLSTYIFFLSNFVVLAFQTILYTWLILKTISRHKKSIKELFSNLQYKKLNWLIYCTIIFFLLVIINNSLLQTDAVDNITIRIYYNISMILITGYWGFAGLQQINIFEGIENINEETPKAQKQDHIEMEQHINEIKITPNMKYVASALSDKERENVIDLLKDNMKTRKLYLNPDLKITDVANEFFIPRKHISQAVNKMLDSNFYNFINKYRIEEAKRLFSDTAFNHYSVEGIARQSGFNSRSSFYTVFKNETGLTPNQYRKKY